MEKKDEKAGGQINKASLVIVIRSNVILHAHLLELRAARYRCQLTFLPCFRRRLFGGSASTSALPDVLDKPLRVSKRRGRR